MVDMVTFAVIAIALYTVSVVFYALGDATTAALFAALGLTATAIMCGVAVNSIRGVR